MKLIVAGGRDFANTRVMIEALTKLVEENKIDSNPELVCGMARGADMLAYSLWANNNMKIHTFPADWKTHPRSAGYIRNAEMGNFADVLVAFWDGKSRGTKHMIEYMQKLGKPTHVIGY